MISLFSLLESLITTFENLAYVLFDASLLQNVLAFFISRYIVLQTSSCVLKFDVIFVFCAVSILISHNNFLSISSNHDVRIMSNNYQLPFFLLSSQERNKVSENRATVQVIFWLIDQDWTFSGTEIKQ